MCARTLSERQSRPAHNYPLDDATRLISRQSAAVLAINDMCPDEAHREAMRRTVLDQAELLSRRLKGLWDDVIDVD